MIVEDAGDGIVLRTIDHIVDRAQALNRKLLDGKAGASVDDFLAERARGGHRVSAVVLDASALLTRFSSTSRAPIVSGL